MTAAVGPDDRRAAGRRRGVGDGPAACSCRPTSSACRVARPVVSETTALGAAYVAGLAEGVWSSTDERRRPGGSSTSAATPAADRADADRRHDRWLPAVDRSATGTARPEARGERPAGPVTWTAGPRRGRPPVHRERGEHGGDTRTCPRRSVAASSQRLGWRARLRARGARAGGCRRPGRAPRPGGALGRGTACRRARAPGPGRSRAAAPTRRPSRCRPASGPRPRPPGCPARYASSQPGLGASSSAARTPSPRPSMSTTATQEAPTTRRAWTTTESSSSSTSSAPTSWAAASRASRRGSCEGVGHRAAPPRPPRRRPGAPRRRAGRPACRRAARPRARRRPGRRHARGCRCPRRRRARRRCGWPPGRAHRAGRAATCGSRTFPRRAPYGVTCEPIVSDARRTRKQLAPAREATATVGWRPGNDATGHRDLAERGGAPPTVRVRCAAAGRTRETP